MKVQNRCQTDPAVSPVVGVLLMLVVTIIIAAVVSGFAGGLAGDTKATPSASIEVKIDTGMNDNMGGAETKMFFEMLSGDPIPTKNLEIITYFTNSSGYVYKRSHNATSPKFDVYGSGSYSRLPFLNDPTKTGGYAGNNVNADFGNFTLSTGDIMCANSVRQTADFLGLPWTEGTYPDPDTIDDADFKPGATVEVTIMHVPSKKNLYSGEVMVI